MSAEPAAGDHARACGCAIGRRIADLAAAPGKQQQPPGSLLRDGPVSIVSAQKASDGGASSYVAYTIRFGQSETKRRYSEFESFRNSLCRLHPCVIVPPIPEKHSIADYASMQKTADDLITVEKRKRMLQSFLNRLVRHSILSTEHVFHRFLDPDTQWNEVLHSAPLNHVPKNPLSAPPGTATNPAGDGSGTPPLAIPNSSTPLRHPDVRFVECEAFTNHFASHMSGPMDKSHRKLIRKLADLANDYSELGALYNGFSLNESGNLAAAIEKVGQAVDSSYMSTSSAVTSLEADFGEPLQEYEMFAKGIRAVLKYRHLKHLQAELAADALEAKRSSLDGLEKMESEARRIDESLRRSSSGALLADPAPGSSSAAGSPDNADGDPARKTPASPHGAPAGNHSSSCAGNSTRLPYSAASGAGSSSTRFGSSSKLLNAVSNTIQSLTDTDPAGTRKKNIGKTRDAIAIVRREDYGRTGPPRAPDLLSRG